MTLKRPISERFWEKVEKGGPIPEHAPFLGPCWLWRGAITSARYGSLFSHIGDKGVNVTVQSHVFSFELENNRKVQGFLDHQCRVRKCVNPSHLKETTHTENLQNRGVRKDSKTGVRGVGKRGSGYRARFQVAGKPLYLGMFPTPEEADRAVRQARKEHMPNSVGDRGES